MTKPSNIKILNDIEHVLARPEMYVGSVQKEKQRRWIFEENKLIEKEVEIIPALLKLFDEVVSNSVDEAIKTNFKFGNKISIYVNPEGVISIYDNGRGLPIEWNEEFQQYLSALAFIKLRAGSNFTDTSDGTIGKFGVGVSLTNIFSSDFKVDTVDGSGKRMVMNCQDHINDVKVKIQENCKQPSGTSISYKIDFKYFGIENYEDVHRGLIQKRVFDLAMNFPEIKFKFNGVTVRSSIFKDYVKLVGNDFVIHEDGYKLAILPSEDFSQISFVNGIETLRGGNHIEIILWRLTTNLRELIKKKYKIEVKPADIKSKLNVILSIKNFPNAKYDSQTKERLVNTTAELTDALNNIPTDFYKKLLYNEAIINPIIDTYLIKEKLKEKEEVRAKNKKLQKVKIAKLVDATSNEREKCILFLTEGDSASSTFITIRDQKYHACMPLRGKVINVMNATDKDIVSNKEYADILAATGLHLHKKSDILQYGKIVILTDMDEDGSSITALLINFFYKYWPELFENGIIRKYLSPLIIAKKKGESEKRFYSLSEFSEFNASGWNIEYYKGLGSLNENEYSKMINNPVEYVFTKDDASIISLDIAFGPSAEKRKTWLGE